jgi:hypothetical protein
MSESPTTTQEPESQLSNVTQEIEPIDIIRYASLSDETGKHYISSPLDPKTRLDAVRKQLIKDGIITDKELFEGKGGSVCSLGVESSLRLEKVLQVLQLCICSTLGVSNHEVF